MWGPVARATLVAGLFVGCSSVPPATTPDVTVPTAAPSQPQLAFTPAPTVSPTAAAPTEGPAASASPSTTPAAQGFAIDWKEHAPTFGDETRVVGSAVLDDRIVVIGSKFGGDGMDRPAIWWEAGDLRWRDAAVPSLERAAELLAIFRVGDSLVALGMRGADSRALLWLSTDGKAWESADGSLFDEVLWNPRLVPVGVAVGGATVLGRHGEPFVTRDGREWRVSTDTNTRQMAEISYGFAGSGTALTAFSKRVVACGGDITGDPCTEGPVLVWRSAGPESWAKVGELPDSDHSMVIGAAVGPRGWVAVGEGIAWFSLDGVEWSRADIPPEGSDAIDPIRIFGTATGFVAVGKYYVDECAIDGEHSDTITWASSDGRRWQIVDTIYNTDLVSLRRRNDSLIGLGNFAQLGGAYGATWTASLPSTGGEFEPPQSPVPLPTPRYTCD
jgi:hypothetical protein